MLPIDDIAEQFGAAVARSNRLVVTAETGAGKSTRIPVWLAERANGLVLVVEPRRVACHALADFLASERGESVGQFFGSRVRFGDRSSAATRVLFCTPGVALRMLCDSRQVLAAVVVDEFHERSWQMDLIVAAVASLPRFAQTPLIVTSATIDAEGAAEVLDATVLHASGRTFPVAVSYDESTVEPSDDELGKRAATATRRALREHDGDVLVFLPGMKEIHATEVALGRCEEEVLIVHGSQPPEAMQRVFRASAKRRVYLSTNVAETSITLPGVRVVIDSGLHKTRLHRAGRAALATVPISAASMEQRAGRAGRVASGACIRLWSERYRPVAFRAPEVERTELDDFVLQAAELGLTGEAFTNARWVTTPPAFAVERASSRLTRLGALAPAGLTDRGLALSALPVSAEEAALLVDAPSEIDATLCDLVAVLQARGSFLRDLGELPPGRQQDAKLARAELLTGVRDEVTMNLRLIRDGQANEHHLSKRRLEEARSISRQLRELVGARGESLDGLASFILRRHPEAGFVLRPRAQKGTRRSRSQPWANGVIEVNVYPFEPLDPEVDAGKPTAGVILETEWLGSGTGVFGIGRMLLPAKPSVLADAGLGEVTIGDVRLDKSHGRVRVTAARDVQLAGVTLSSGEAPLEGAELHAAVAKFTFEGRLFKGVATTIADMLHAWRVLADWPNPDELGGYGVPEPPLADPQEWLAARIALLGVERASDLALLEADDLTPELAAVTGIPDWVTSPIVDDFPRLWTYQGATYTCDVSPSSGKVTLEPCDATARKAGEPPARVLPRFRNFKVVFRQASRVLRLR